MVAAKHFAAVRRLRVRLGGDANEEGDDEEDGGGGIPRRVVLLALCGAASAWIPRAPRAAAPRAAPLPVAIPLDAALF